MNELARTMDPIQGPKPSLLIVGPLPPPYLGPAFATTRLLASPVLAECFEIQFLDTTDKGGSEDMGQLSIRNVVIAFQQGWRSVRQLFRDRPDAIYVPIARGLWGFLRDLLFLVPARVLGVKVIIHLRAGRFDIMHDDGAIGRLIGRIGLRCATRAIVLGEAVRGVFGDVIPQQEIRIVPNGMNLDGWNAEEWEQGRNWQDEFRVAYLANVYEDKGAHMMLAALPRIIEKIPNVKVTFAGMIKDRAFHARCLDFVRTHGLEPYVEFIGQVDDDEKKRLLAGSDIAVFVPVKPEGLPWVVLEAMAAGLPVIGTPQGTMTEVIVDGETGFIVPTRDIDALADRVILLALDAGLRRTMGRSGRQRVEQRFSETVNHRKLAEVVLDSLN